MNNAFYYFFSAVPQVLAGVLALFGVFVIFKIQAIRSELGKLVEEMYNSYKNSFPSVIMFELVAVRNNIEDALKNNDVQRLNSIFKDFAEGYVNSFLSQYSNKVTLIKNLITAVLWTSIFISFVIILCLALIPCDSFINCHQTLLTGIFIFVIVCLCIIFSSLVVILLKSLNE